MMTPAVVHEGHAEAVYAARQAVLDQAYLAHPERFPRGAPAAATSGASLDQQAKRRK